LGTIHLAFGTSAAIGGVNRSTVHIDGLVLRPTVWLDDRVLMEDGVLVTT
jgi:aminopeptidase